MSRGGGEVRLPSRTLSERTDKVTEESPWKHLLDLSNIFADSTMGYTARRDEITRRIRMSWFYLATKATDDQILLPLVDEMAAAETDADFDPLWDRFYDWCDEHRVQVKVVPDP